MFDFLQFVIARFNTEIYYRLERKAFRCGPVQTGFPGFIFKNFTELLEKQICIVPRNIMLTLQGFAETQP